MVIVSQEYIKKEKRYLESYPLIPIRVVIDGKELDPIEAIVDTGFEGDILISKVKISEMKIPNDYEITNDTSNIELANKRKIRSKLYGLPIKIGTVTFDSTVAVPDTDEKLLWDAFIGLEFLNSYKVTLDGKVNPKKITIDD